MKIAATIARYLLGIIFAVFGANGFLQFIPQPPQPPLVMQFMGALMASHYYVVIFAAQLICGILLLINRYVPLALVVLAAVIVNIFTFHIAMAPSGLPVATFVLIVWVLVALDRRESFAGILAS